jgi:hypothetical protein
MPRARRHPTIELSHPIDWRDTLAALLDRPPTAALATADHATRLPAEGKAARRSLDEVTDRRTGLVAVGVIGGLGLLLATILTAILIYSFSWGYAIQL